MMSVVADPASTRWETLRIYTPDLLARVMHVFTNEVFQRRLDKQIPVAGEAALVREGAALTRREQECMAWAARGKTAEEIAIILGRSRETVRLHLKRCISKMNATNRTQAVLHARERGLI